MAYDPNLDPRVLALTNELSVFCEEEEEEAAYSRTTAGDAAQEKDDLEIHENYGG